MIKLNRQLGLATVLTTALLAGCGGGGGDGYSEPAPQADMKTELSAERVFAYISNLINGTGENAGLVDVNTLTLAGDDTVEPTALP